VKSRHILALAIFIVPWVFWIYAIMSASNSGFTENEFAVQLMVLGGAVSMVAASVAAIW
jgi:hypothetical protein